MIRVRIAPSPTGIPHIGNTRTALFNYLFAKHNNGKFIVRIEDTDQARIVPGAKEAIFEILKWLGIAWDEEYTQSDRKEIYEKHVKVLLEKGAAYKDEGAVRFKVPIGKEVSWTDGVGNKKIIFKTDVVEDFVILKSDGFPTYHLANVVDDYLMNISHVIRGEEWISSTPKHLLLYESFDWNPPVFIHPPNILGTDHKKLSKRHGAKSVIDYRKEGYLREAILNFIAFLGWYPAGAEREKELISIEEMIKLFDVKDINTASPIFDIQKLDWMNGEYVRMTDNQKLKLMLADFYQTDSDVLNMLKNSSDLIIDLAKTRMKTLAEFKNLVLFRKPELSQEEKNIGKITLDKFSSVSTWTKDSILSSMREILGEAKIKGKMLYKIITGFESGLPLPETLEILGKEKTIERIKSAIE